MTFRQLDLARVAAGPPLDRVKHPHQVRQRQRQPNADSLFTLTQKRGLRRFLRVAIRQDSNPIKSVIPRPSFGKINSQTT